MKRTLIFAISILFASVAAANEGHQPYRGMEAREISSLSDQDIRSLSEGSGWGLALPAELNGYPGPAHVLELGDALGLSEDQRIKVEAIFEAMRDEAIANGKTLIEAERRLDEGFKSGALDKRALRLLIEDAASARARLRFVHLSRHLETLDVLSREQVRTYAKLRGYAPDPCASVPEGHDPEMWRRHNGCVSQ